MVLLLFAVVALLGATIAVTVWRDRQRRSGRDALPHRLFDGAVAGLGVMLLSALAAAAAVAFLAAPVKHLVERLGLATRWPRGAMVMDESVLLVAVVGAVAAAAWVGSTCVRPARVGALRGVGVLAFAAVTAGATALSPLNVTDTWRWLAVAISAVAAGVLAGTGLLVRPHE